MTDNKPDDCTCGGKPHRAFCPVGLRMMLNIHEPSFAGEVKAADSEETKAIEEMLDRIESDYPNLTRDEMREMFHSTYERLAAEDSVNESQELAGVSTESRNTEQGLLPCPFCGEEAQELGMQGKSLVRHYPHTDWLTPEQWNSRADIA